MIKSVAKITIAALFITTSYFAAAAQRHFTVMPEAAARQVTGQLCSREGVSGVDGSWKLSPAIVSRIEKSLRQIAKLKSVGPPIRHPETYFRQYFGITVSGRRLVYINAFAEPEGDPPSYWRDRLEDICDGGPVSWGVLYDPAHGTFRDLRTNGVIPGP